MLVTIRTSGSSLVTRRRLGGRALLTQALPTRVGCTLLPSIFNLTQCVASGVLLMLVCTALLPWSSMGIIPTIPIMLERVRCSPACPLSEPTTSLTYTQDITVHHVYSCARFYSVFGWGQNLQHYGWALPMLLQLGGTALDASWQENLDFVVWLEGWLHHAMVVLIFLFLCHPAPGDPGRIVGPVKLEKRVAGDLPYATCRPWRKPIFDGGRETSPPT